MAERRWVFVIRSCDRPGALTATASAFSNRGVSLEGVLGSGIDSSTAEDARIILSFQATEAKQITLRRVVERLANVLQIDVYAYDDPGLRAIAIARLPPDRPLPVDDAIQLEVMSQQPNHTTVLLTGGTLAIEALLQTLRQQQGLLDVVMTAIAI